MTLIDELAGAMARHAPSDGVHATLVPKMTLLRYSRTMEQIHTLYEPALCVVAQGRKQAMLGETAYIYDAAKYLVVAVDLPVVGSVLEASEDRPYLCLRFDLDLVALGELVLSHAGERVAPARGLAPGLALSEANGGFIDAVTRLVRLLDEPENVGALAPLVEREILYRLMIGDQSDMVRHIVNSESRLSQIGRAIAWLKINYTVPLSIETLAEIAMMSASSFHQHFKSVTSMTPLQYRNQLRLQEARRLMVMEGYEAASAGFEVGFGSPSQFSREYARLFGSSPARDAARMRETPAYSMVA